MKIISGERGTGKTKQLLELAAETGAIILTSNSRALYAKAHGYGITNLRIYEPSEYNYDDLFMEKILIHKAEELLPSYFKNFFDAEVIGMTLTKEN